MRHLIRSFVDEGRTVSLSSHLLDEVEKTATTWRSSTVDASSFRAVSRRSRRAAIRPVPDRGRRPRRGEADPRANGLRDRRRGSRAARDAHSRSHSGAVERGAGRRRPRRLSSGACARDARADTRDHLAVGVFGMSLIRAEILKLRRRRGLMIWSLILTVGAVLLAEIIVVSLHLANPAHHGPAGGESNFEGYTFLVGGLGDVAAIIIASTAGTQDVSNGVFRDLVVTGRSRATSSTCAFRVRSPCSCRCWRPVSSSRWPGPSFRRRPPDTDRQRHRAHRRVRRARDLHQRHARDRACRVHELAHRRRRS